MPELPKKKVGIITCSGEEIPEGTVTRLAALKVLEQLRPTDTVYHLPAPFPGWRRRETGLSPASIPPSPSMAAINAVPRAAPKCIGETRRQHRGDKTRCRTWPGKTTRETPSE